MEGLHINRIRSARTQIRKWLSSTRGLWNRWIEQHPGLVKAYTIFSWVALVVFAVSLIFSEISRQLLVQYFWSFYILLQFWFLCRSKTFTWKRFMMFFFAGVWVSIPLTVLSTSLVHAVFGGSTMATWSQAGVTPFVEELFKLAPLGIYLFLSKRRSSLSLTDFILMGGAAGAGFQFAEEVVRRWTTGPSILGMLFNVFDEKWELFTWFPGEFHGAPSAYAGHGVVTALIALSIGLGFRLKRRFGSYAWILPGFLFLWGVLDHAVYNGGSGLPDWLEAIHNWLGNGELEKPLLLWGLVLALILDYWALYRVRSELTLLQNEILVEPFTEFFQPLLALFTNKFRTGYLYAFFRERRELGFTLLYGNQEGKERIPELRQHTREIYQSLLILAGVLLLAIGVVDWTVGAGSLTDACFSCLFDGLQNWWDNLSWWQKSIVVAGLFAGGLVFVEAGAAIGFALTATSLAASGHEIARNIRDPRRLLSPGGAISLAA
ncbi:MAG TPA: PrsW family glutamic-type intramembrane protease, partial [Bacillales bacterium]